jgi:hypothetical protein
MDDPGVEISNQYRQADPPALKAGFESTLE